MAGAAFSNDGKIIASGGPDGTVRLWGVASGGEIKRIGGHAGVVTAVAFSRDGQILVSGSADGTIRLWQMTSVSVRRR